MFVADAQFLQRFRTFLFLAAPLSRTFLKVPSALTRIRGLAAATHEFIRKHWQRALQVREKIRFSEGAFHLILAGGVGVIGGLVNLLFYYSTELVRHLALRFPGEIVEVAERVEPWQRVLTPTLGG